MKKVFLFIFLFSSISSSGYASSIAKQWERIYLAGGWLDTAFSIQQTLDGGYVTAGVSSALGGTMGFRVLKIDYNGEISWEKKYEDLYSHSLALSIKQSLDGGYIVAGYVYGNMRDIRVIKLDNNGNVIWQKTYGGMAEDGNASIVETSDGGYILVGGTLSFGQGGFDVWVLKLDNVGNITWQKTYGGPSEDGYTYSEWTYSIQQTQEGGYIVAGATSSFGAGQEDFWVLKLDSVGNVTWQKTYGGSGSDVATSIQQTAEGGYLVAGQTTSFNSINWNIWVLKLDDNGNVLWQKVFNNSDNYGNSQDLASSIQQTSDNGFVMGCSADRRLQVIKLDDTGGFVWGKIYSEFLSGIFPDIKQIIDEGYIVASMGSHDDTNYNFWVLKLDSNGNIPGCDLIEEMTPSIYSPSLSLHNTYVTPQLSNAIITTAEITTINITSELSSLCQYDDPSDIDADGIDNNPGEMIESSIGTSSFLTDDDNCSEVPNGPFLGTCIAGNSGGTCISNEACGVGGVCSMNQQDTDGDGLGDACDDCTDTDNDGYGNPEFLNNTCLPDNCPNDYNPNQEDESPPPAGNGIADACDCEGNFDCDGDCDGTDAAAFKLDFGRSTFDNPCEDDDQCNGDFDCDNDSDGTDAALFKQDFGRSGFNNPCPACTQGDWCVYP